MSGRHIIGAILILLGTGFLLDQLDIWDFSGLLGTWWPTAIILIGVKLGRRSVPVIAGSSSLDRRHAPERASRRIA